MNAREVALNALCEIDKHGAYSDKALKNILKTSKLSTADKAFATELTYGVVRNKMRLDYIISKYSKIRLKKISTVILNLLRIGIYQMLFLDKVPQGAAVNESVVLAKKYGHASSAKFANAVLREFARSGDVTYPSGIEGNCIYYSHPQWMVEMWIAQFGEVEAKRLMKANNTPPATTARVNRLKVTEDEVIQSLTEKGISAEKTELPNMLWISKYGNMAKLTEYESGMLTPQDMAAYQAAYVLQPKEGETVIDVCSAPGGKTTQIAELANNKANIIAFDIHPHKIELIKKNAERLGITCIHASVWDAENVNEQYIGNADKVLADVPCSGLGIIRKKPDIKWSKTAEDIRQIITIQKRILIASSQYVKIGGTLVYATCTINKAENEDLVAEFVKNSDFTIKEQRQSLPHRDNCDGFYYAVLERI